MASGEFDTIITKTRPHILEKICLSLDYDTFKNCVEVNEAWKTVLTATAFQKKAKSAFWEEILGEEKDLRKKEGICECVCACTVGVCIILFCVII